MTKAQPKPSITPEQEILSKNWGEYRGSIVMVVEDKIFATKRAKNVDRLLKDIEQKFHKQPLITYIPKEGTLILPQDPVGFLATNYIPPLLGRQEFFETFKVTFENSHTYFKEPR